jgi:hypothetical protein
METGLVSPGGIEQAAPALRALPVEHQAVMDQLIFHALLLRQDQANHDQLLGFEAFIEDALAVMVQFSILSDTEQTGLRADGVGEGIAG